MVPVFTEAT